MNLSVFGLSLDSGVFSPKFFLSVISKELLKNWGSHELFDGIRPASEERSYLVSTEIGDPLFAHEILEDFQNYIDDKTDIK